jgi:hypothetical protein
MKKHAILAAMMLVVCAAAFGEVDQKVLRATVATTNTDTCTLRGTLDSFRVVVGSAMTCSVSIANSDGTVLLSASGLTAGTNWYYPRWPFQTVAAVDVSSTIVIPCYSGTNDTLITAQTNTFVPYGPITVVGDVTATFINTAGNTGECSVAVNFIK